MRYSLFFFLIFAFTSVFSQAENLLPQRQAYKLSLPVDKNSIYEMEVAASPYVQRETIVQIYPGETIYMEAEETGGFLKLISVKKIQHSAKTITISCIQNVDQGKHQGIMLKLHNPFDKDLLYSARIFLMTANKWASTNVVPVAAGLSSFELWPDVIITLGLSDWKFAKK